MGVDGKMVSEPGLAKETAGEDRTITPDRAGAEGEGQVRGKSPARAGQQIKYPRLVRLALFLGLPVLLWGGIFAVLRLLG